MPPHLSGRVDVEIAGAQRLVVMIVAQPTMGCFAMGVSRQQRQGANEPVSPRSSTAAKRQRRDGDDGTAPTMRVVAAWQQQQGANDAYRMTAKRSRRWTPA